MAACSIESSEVRTSDILTTAHNIGYIDTFLSMLYDIDFIAQTGDPTNTGEGTCTIIYIGSTIIVSCIISDILCLFGFMQICRW